MTNGIQASDIPSASLVDALLGMVTTGGVTDLRRIAMAALVQQLVALITVSAVGGQSYPTTAAGLAATAEGGYFTVPEGSDGGLRLYREVSGAAVQVARVLGKADLDAAVAVLAPLASPALTGVPTAPTAAAGTSTTQIATTAFVGAAVDVEAAARAAVVAAAVAAEAALRQAADAAEATERDRQINLAVGRPVLDETVVDGVLGANGVWIRCTEQGGYSRASDTRPLLDEVLRSATVQRDGMTVVEGIDTRGRPWPGPATGEPPYRQLLDEIWSIVSETARDGSPTVGIRNTGARPPETRQILDEHIAWGELAATRAPGLHALVAGVTVRGDPVSGSPFPVAEAWVDAGGEVVALIRGRRVQLSFDTPAGTRNVLPVVHARSVDWLEDDGATVMRRERYLVPRSPFTIAGDVEHVIITGNSLAYGNGSVKLHTGTARAGVAAMFNTGPRPNGMVEPDIPTPPENIQAFVDLQEGSASESPAVGVGIAMTNTALGGRVDRPLLVTTVAKGSTRITDIDRGTQVYANALGVSRQARVCSALDGRGYVPKYMLLNNGSSDQTDTVEQFLTKILAFYDHYAEDLGASAASPLHMLLAQYSDWTSYDYVTCDMPAAQLLAGLAPEVAEAMLTMTGSTHAGATIAATYSEGASPSFGRRRIYCAGPTYHLARVDGRHFLNTSMSLLSQHAGYIFNIISSTGKWEPLHYVDWTVDGANIVYHYRRPTGDGDLVLNDVDVTDPGMKGWTWTQTAGADRAITGVSVSGMDLILTFDGDLTGCAGEVGYAARGVAGQWSGPTTGARGCLCTRTGKYIDDGREIINWAAIQKSQISL